MTAPSLPAIPTGIDRVVLIAIVAVMVAIAVGCWVEYRREHKSGERG